MLVPNYCLCLVNMGMCFDRFCPGYSNPVPLEEMFRRAASIPGVTGVELNGGAHITSENVEEIRGYLARTGLRLASIIPDHFSHKQWKTGAFTSKDPGLRREAVRHTREMMDAAKRLNCDLISLWPGQDGYDYYFQSDYIKERTWFEECVAECCSHNPAMRISIEYKPKEPRTHSYPSNVYATLLMVREIGMDNCGVTIDYGHGVVAGENVAESVAVLKKYGDKLFHLHINDNYGLWDDDMIAGTVHTIPYLELFYWLKRTGYSGWFSADQFPYRENGRDATDETMRWMDAFIALVNKLDDGKVEEVISSGDAVRCSRLMREILLS